ncbi:phage tail assembly chaperone [Dethiothermospora halolimnae]|uniref:phage tail assembly chaperone n=1 Tax=Dethiothermospora halolimnae TaxID=3114390 RepID=UPI003CCC2F2B
MTNKNTRDLSFFMKGKANEAMTREVIISKRYTDENGNPIPVLLKPTTTEKVERFQKECTVIKGKGNGAKEVVDNIRFAGKLAIECCVYPDFKDKELLKSYECVDPIDLIKKIFSLPGEYAELMNQVLSINGFDEDYEKLVEDAKN